MALRMGPLSAFARFPFGGVLLGALRFEGTGRQYESELFFTQLFQAKYLHELRQC